jgi:type 1 glutamine amidotransferase
VTGVALVLTGGHSHPPELSAPALAAVLGAAGLTPVVATDIEAALGDIDAIAPDLIVVNALRWTMTHPRYAEFREAWALSLSSSARQSLADWVEAGGALLALHAALVCFDDWPGWADLIGARWDWERSRHPPLGPVMVEPDAGHPLARGLSPFTVTDECYVDLDIRPGNEMVAEASTDEISPQPAAWVRKVGDGRVATSTLGHDLRSLDDPAHRTLLTTLIEWTQSSRDSVHVDPTRPEPVP